MRLAGIRDSPRALPDLRGQWGPTGCFADGCPLGLASAGRLLEARGARRPGRRAGWGGRAVCPREGGRWVACLSTPKQPYCRKWGSKAMACRIPSRSMRAKLDASTRLRSVSRYVRWRLRLPGRPARPVSGIWAVISDRDHLLFPWKGWFGLLFPHRLLDFRPSSLKPIQSLFQVSHFLLDLAQLCLVLAARQAVRAKLLNDILLKLTPQDSEIRVAPYRPSRYSSLPARMPFTMKSRLTPYSFWAVTSLRVAPLRFHSPYSAISHLSDRAPRLSGRDAFRGPLEPPVDVLIGLTIQPQRLNVVLKKLWPLPIGGNARGVELNERSCRFRPLALPGSTKCGEHGVSDDGIELPHLSIGQVPGVEVLNGIPDDHGDEHRHRTFVFDSRFFPLAHIRLQYV